MFVTRIPRGVKPQVKAAQGPASQPHFESVQAETWKLRSYISSQEYPMPGSRSKPGGVAGRPAIHHLQTDSIKLVEAPLDLYIRILTVELTHTTLFL
jgi:hypothetical protein